MESVSVKFQENIVKKIDEAILQKNFNSRTEFIREAVRDKLEEFDKDKIIMEFMKLYGKSKKKTTYEENRNTRELVGKELQQELERKFNL